jgi:hypothetical protein
MTDITSSTKTLFVSDGSGGGLDPYVRKIDDMMELAGRCFGPGRLAGGTITAVGSVSIPAGTILVLPMGSDGRRKALVEFMAAVTVTATTNDYVYASVSKDASGQATVDVSAAAAAPAGTLTLGQATGGPPITTWADDGRLDQQNPKRIYVPFTPSLDVTGANSAWAISPVGGRVRRVRTVMTTAVTIGDATQTVEIGGVAVTGMSVVCAFTGSAIGQTDDSGEQTDDATNIVAAGGAIEIVSDGGATAGVIDGIVEIEPF